MPEANNPDNQRPPQLQPPEQQGSEQMDSASESGNESSAKLLEQGTKALQESTKSEDFSAGLAGMALIIAALFAFIRERREARLKGQQAAPDTGGMDARTVDNVDDELAKTQKQMEEGGSREATLRQTEETIQKNISAIPTTATDRTEQTTKLNTELTAVRQELAKITVEQAQMRARVTALTIEKGRRRTLEEGMNKTIQANPNRLAEGVSIHGNRLEIMFRRQATEAEGKRLEEIVKQFGSLGLQINREQNPMAITVPAVFWSEWSNGQASVGRGGRLAILSWLCGPRPPAANEATQKQNNQPAPPPIETIPQPPAKVKEDAAQQTKEKEDQTKSGNQPGDKANQAAQKIEKTQAQPPAPAFSSAEFMRGGVEAAPAQVLERLLAGESIRPDSIVRVGAVMILAYRKATDPAVPRPIRDSAERIRKQLSDEYSRRTRLAGGEMTILGEGDGIAAEVRFPTADTLIALKELLGYTPPHDYITLNNLPVSVWRESPDGNSPSIGMLLGLLGKRPLTPQERQALNRLTPFSSSVKNFNDTCTIAEVQLAPDNITPVFRIKMAINHPQYAVTSDRFRKAVTGITPITGETRTQFQVDANVLRAPGTLDRIRDAIEGNRREVTPEQADREALLLLVDHLPMTLSRNKYDRAKCGGFSNGIIVEQIIFALSERANVPFRTITGMYCDDDGHLRQDSRGGADGPMLISNWATTLRTNPTLAIALLSGIRHEPGSGSGGFSATRLGGSLDALNRTMTMRRPVTAQEQTQEVDRRYVDIQISDLYIRLENRLRTRSEAFQNMLAQNDNISLGDRISEGIIGTAINPVGYTVLELANFAGLELPGDPRPTAAVREIRARTREALELNEKLLKELPTSLEQTSTIQKINRFDSIRQRMRDLNFQDINTRMEWTRKVCTAAEMGLHVADVAGETFAERVPVVGPVIYSSLRNGVGMMGGEQIRNPDGSMRNRDWGDFGINVAVSAIPFASLMNRIPGMKPLAGSMLRRAIAYSAREVGRAAIDQARDTIRDELEKIVQKARDGKSWEEIWDETFTAQERDEVITSFLVGTAARTIVGVLGDQAGGALGDIFSRGMRFSRQSIQKMTQPLMKRMRQGAQNLANSQLVDPAREIVEQIIKEENSAA